ncbi:MAG: DsbA family protein [Planctomycetota bacterium]|nr:DsbA family protein [Planctomycetota bacterium]
MVFTGYQCPDCRVFEEHLAAALRSRPWVSVSTKHFPFSTACNPHVPRTLHAGACEAAQLAEAAGIVGGDQMHWRVHDWLFARGGVFTIDEAARMLAMDADALRATMAQPQVAQALRHDVDEAISLGLMRTPLAFINGVELRGWRRAEDIARALDAAGSNPRRVAPPAAAQKVLEDWRAQPVLPMKEGIVVHEASGVDGVVRVDVFGSYGERFTAELDAEVRRLAAGGAPIRYLFHHFPADGTCNRLVSGRTNQLCALAAQVESIGDVAARVRAHVALMDAMSRGGEAELQAMLAQLAKEHPPTPDALARVRSSVDAAIALGIDTIPAVVVQSRRAPRWKLGDEWMIDDMVLAK